MAVAQDLGPGGVQYQFNLSQGLSWDSDFAMASFGARSAAYGTTRLSFGISSETRTERIALESGATLRLLPSFARDAGAEVAEPFFALTYSRDAARSGLTLSARHEREGLAFADQFAGVIGPDGALRPLAAPEDVEGGGLRAITTLAARMDTGRDMPVSFDFGISATRTNLFGATDPDLEESSGAAADLGVTLVISPFLQGLVRTGYTISEERDLAATRTEEGRLVFGLSYRPTQDFTLTAEAGPVWQRDRSFGLTTEDLGATAGLTAVWSRPRWELTAALSGTEVGDDRSYSGSVDWRASFETGQLLARASYDIVPGDATDPEETISFLGVGYLYDLDPIAQLGVSIAASETETTGLLLPDRSVSVGASYRRALSRDVTVAAGYQFRRREDGPAGRTESHGLFLEFALDTEGLF
jgi:hypothetical protein